MDLSPPRENDLGRLHSLRMRDEKTIKIRLEQLRGQLLQWGTPDLMVFVITKDELRGWIRALEWILGKPGVDTKES